MTIRNKINGGISLDGMLYYKIVKKVCKLQTFLCLYTC